MPHAQTGRQGASLATPYGPPRPAIRAIGTDDVLAALKEGYGDFLAMPSHLAFLGVFYPLFGLVLGFLVFSDDGLSLVFPLVAGFALVGPLAAVPLYEASRRREQGLGDSWAAALDALRRPAIASIAIVGLLLAGLFALWMASAQLLFAWIWGPEPLAGPLDFLSEVLTTPRGWALILVGHAVGLVFALAAFAIGVVSLPMLVERDVGAGVALATSVAAVRRNPRAMALWAAIVAGLLIVGSAPLLVGLTVAMPILGHATWRLYRRVIDPASVAVTPERR